MFKFSVKSEQLLNTVKKELNVLAHEVLKITPIDFSITEGYRDKDTQYKYFLEKKSKCDGIEKLSKHQTGDAIDILPCKERYTQAKDIFILIGLFIATAKQLNINIKVGALWNYNSTKDNSFIDAYHIELS